MEENRKKAEKSIDKLWRALDILGLALMPSKSRQNSASVWYFSILNSSGEEVGKAEMYSRKQEIVIDVRYHY